MIAAVPWLLTGQDWTIFFITACGTTLALVRKANGFVRSLAYVAQNV